jgi:asparagine N-glycosylation enzyme membrane subunit Stt3
MKQWYESKTVIFNIVMTIVMAVPVIAAAYKAVTPEAAVLIDSIAGLITGLGNIMLRVWFTDTPIDTPKARAARTAARFREMGM